MPNAKPSEAAEPGVHKHAQVLTQDSFKPFGWVIEPEVDGTPFDAASHAELQLSQGQPRFYIMRVPEERGMTIYSITQHKQVSQCLGAAASSPHCWFLAVASPDLQHPSVHDVIVFQIPPSKIVKLHPSTWYKFFFSLTAKCIIMFFPFLDFAILFWSTLISNVACVHEHRHAGPFFTGRDCFDFINLELTGAHITSLHHKRKIQCA